LVNALTGAVFSAYRPTRFTDRRQTDPSHRNMKEGKYCQFIIIFTKYWGGYNHLHPTSNFGGPSPCPPLNLPVMPTGLPVEVIAKVPPRYYRVPRYFFTVLTVAHNRWYHPTLLESFVLLCVLLTE